MKRQLGALIPNPGGSLIIKQKPDGREIHFGGCKMQSGLSVVVFWRQYLLPVGVANALVALTSAPFDSSKPARSVPPKWEEAIIKGVQPNPS
jgi:hypothetical protein